MEQMELMQALNWRYATNIFDESKKVDDHNLQQILEATNLSATSFGIQAYKMIVLKGEEWKQRLQTATFNQENIQTASHILVFCARTDVDKNYVNNYISHMEDVRDLDEGRLQRYGKVIKDYVSGLEESKKQTWLAHQVYLAVGNLLTICALYKIDACPMEGFHAKLLDEILDLNAKNLRSILVVPIGFRSEKDKYAITKKVRKPLAEMVIEM